MKHYILLLVVCCCFCNCASQVKVRNLRSGDVSASLALEEKWAPKEYSFDIPARDTLKVEGENGEELLIMRAVRDENGEMVATDEITAAVVTAKFRNVAERHGKVDLCFDVIVPEDLQDSRWQIRLSPEMSILGENISLDPVIITGKTYRNAQLRGYQQYEKFLSSIVTDSSEFVNRKELEIFLERNLPEIYDLKNDTSYVSDEGLKSVFGITQRDALDHYTSQSRIRSNDRKISRKDMMYAKFVKNPIVTEGLRLDTLLTSVNGDVVYEYVQSVNVGPELRNVGITLSGSVYDEDRCIYNIPETDTLTFYISSLSTLVDDREKYVTKVIERKVNENTSCRIDFEQGSSDVNLEMGTNMSEIQRIENILVTLMDNREFDIDSILVTASSSPEGNYNLNKSLSQRRSEAVTDYIKKFTRRYADSTMAEYGYVVNIDEQFQPARDVQEIIFISKSLNENWDMLESLVMDDTFLTDSDKREIEKIMEENDLDARERLLAGMPVSKYLNEKIYPQLRTVKFDFFLHRKNMAKDTVHTTVLDSTYMKGVDAIKERQYQQALTLLREYQDYNTAVAYCSLDYNSSAIDILERLPESGNVEYLLAILYSRKNEDQEAVQHYLNACSFDRSYVFRGNLDPEISVLIKNYRLNLDE